MLLATVVEGQLINSRPASYLPQNSDDDPALWNGTQPVGRIYAVLVMMVGEVLALWSLRSSSVAQSGLTQGMVWLSVSVGLMAVVLPVLGRQWQYLRQWGSAAKGRWIAVLAGVLLIVLTFAWVQFFR